jgi:hypothetical protein
MKLVCKIKFRPAIRWGCHLRKIQSTNIKKFQKNEMNRLQTQAKMELYHQFPIELSEDQVAIIIEELFYL